MNYESFYSKQQNKIIVQARKTTKLINKEIINKDTIFITFRSHAHITSLARI